MKSWTTRTTGILHRLTRFFGAMLALALLVPVTAVSQSLAPVNLGSTANFAILAGSTVTNIPTSTINGNVGLSPAAGSFIGLTSAQVIGTIYTVDATGPAGSVVAATMLTTAKGDLTIAYNDAAGRTPVPTGPFLNPGSGNIGGSAPVPGLYKFTGAAEITGSNVTLSGSATDVWIFQIATTLTVGNGIQVILGGSAKAANIFWQVGTSASLGTTSVFKGTIMADQSISVASGATVEGRLLASSAAVTLSANTVTTPATGTAVSKNDLAPQEFALFQNYPNPFNPSTKIEYDLVKAGIVTLKVYNVLGNEVATLVNGRQEAGSYTVPFGTNNVTTGLSSGVYFYRLAAGSFVSTKKLILMK